MTTPVLLITFNRPEHTSRVLSAIREQEPRELFVFQDGAREGNDSDLKRCASVRNIVRRLVEWDCELHTFYSDRNLGCGAGPMTAIVQTVQELRR